MMKNKKLISVLLLGFLFLQGCATRASSTVIEVTVKNKLKQQVVMSDFANLARKSNFKIIENKKYYAQNCKYQFSDPSPKGGTFYICSSKNKKRVVLAYRNFPVVLIPFPRMTWPHRKFHNKMLKKASFYKYKYKIDAKWYFSPDNIVEELKIPS